jgi:hypothetical protein
MNNRGNIVILIVGLSVLGQHKSRGSRLARTIMLTRRKQTESEQSRRYGEDEGSALV